MIFFFLDEFQQNMFHPLFHATENNTRDAVKTALCTLGAYLIFGHSRGGLIREEAYSQNSEKDICESFSVLLPKILRIQHTMLQVKYINLTPFYPKSYQN